MRTANPALNAQTFQRFDAQETTQSMTLDGTVTKTGILLALVFGAAAYSWVQLAGGGQLPYPLLIGSLIAAFVFALITIFNKAWSPWTAPLYAVCEGVFLGAISLVFESMYPGIVFQAVVLTFGTLFALLIVYRSRLIRATENFKLGVCAATGGICMIYLVTFVLGIFGTGIPYIHGAGIVGIGFSLVVVVIAALNLVLDFDFIEQGVAAGAPKYMEWYGAFGLIVTLVWLYLEILRLLSKLRDR
ncbi:MAG: hypothetical protein CMJ59_00115 [Planctomycetaceae bacterium]|nr:hypothetical protein [Planctomycetaceae bacterium]